jgi:hypothetical protein
MREHVWDTRWSILLNDSAKARIIRRYQLIARVGIWILGLFCIGYIVDTALMKSIADIASQAIPITHIFMKAGLVYAGTLFACLVTLITSEILKTKMDK